MTLLTACGGGGSSSFSETNQIKENSSAPQNIASQFANEDDTGNDTEAEAADAFAEDSEATGALESPAQSEEGTTQTQSASTEEESPKEPAVSGSTDTEPDASVGAEEPVEECRRGPARGTGKVFAYSGGKPLANVKVSIGGCETVTDENGLYTLTNIAEDDKAVVTFTAEGYYKNSAIIQVRQYVNGTKEISPNYLGYPLDPYDSQESYDSQSAKVFVTAKGASVEIPAGVYVDSEGNAYDGTVTADLAYEDIFTSKGRYEFPGGYEGIDANGEKRLFTSYGMIVVDLKDSEGDALDVADPMIVKFPAVSKLKAETVPLWYYDYKEGTWIEEGYATRQDDGSYRGEISHAGTWSLNVPVEDAPGIYKGRIVYEDGTPARGIRIQARGENWIETDLSTDEDGWFEIEVVPNSDFTIRAYDYVKKFEAVFKGNIAGIRSGELFEDKR